jgi:hypothetical protein
MTSRQFTAIALLASVLTVALLVPVWMAPDRDIDSAPHSSPSSVVSASSTIPTRDEVVWRLREILRIREQAYRLRSTELLATIYSTDCPCMASDQKAIEELLNQGHIWDGIATSIDIRSARRVNERLWLVVGLFRSETLSIKTEHGELIRTEPAGSDLFECTLVNSNDTTKWLLGLASILEGD